MANIQAATDAIAHLRTLSLAPPMDSASVAFRVSVNRATRQPLYSSVGIFVSRLPSSKKLWLLEQS